MRDVGHLAKNAFHSFELAVIGLCVCVGILVSSSPAKAIFGGTIDSANQYSNVVNLFGCTGTLVAPRVVMTAGHCFANYDGTVANTIFYYSFDAQFPYPVSTPDDLKALAAQGLVKTVDNTNGGHAFIHPDFVSDEDIFSNPPPPGGVDSWRQNWNDIGVIILDHPENGITPARIAPLDYLATNGSTAGTLYTLAGYGIHNEDSSATNKPKADAPGKMTFGVDWKRRYTTAPLQNLFTDVIQMSTTANDSRGGGGRCFGDSGGPSFLNGYLVGVGAWVWGGPFGSVTPGCVAGQTADQRLDDADARSFWEPLLQQYGQ